MASAGMQVRGVGQVSVALRQVGKDIGNNALAGLYTAGLKVQRLAQQRVPREYGFLVGSAYTRPPEHSTVTVGFSSHYALFVHENMEMKLRGKPRPSGLGVYWGPAGQPKFLESALREVKISIDVAARVKQGLKKGNK